MHIDHIIKAKERDVVICEGYVELAFLDAKTNRPTRAPKLFIDAVKNIMIKMDKSVLKLIKTALQEDVKNGDITTKATISKSKKLLVNFL